ncbi:MAG TPA: M48 family metalloprotease [Xanthobacteraceae bacterium]|nr:M48 family metalloprotease [Xanthobacteraceae bacterium]
MPSNTDTTTATGIAFAIARLEPFRTFLRTARLLVPLSLVLAACSAQPAADPPPVAAANLEKTPELAPAVQREHARILAAYGGAYEQPQLEALLAKTVDRLVAASERPDLKYKITILNSPSINAFALSSGQLYITRGLIALANDSSELASVLSHEMAHVIARHAAFREDQARQAQVYSRVYTELLGDPQMGALALARSKVALAIFSRAQEFEADGIGVGISARAGFDPYGAQRLLTSMELNAELNSHVAGRTTANANTSPPDFLSSHPSTPDRIRNARANARQYASPGTGKRDKNEYLKMLDGLVYGDDPSEGIVRGRRFLHPKLGFTFTAPAGFSLDNTAQAVFGIKDNGTQALRLDVVHAAPNQAPTDYLNSSWLENIDGKSITETVINGLPAATATATNDEWAFRLFIIRFDDDMCRFIFASKHATETAERAIGESIATFRRLIPAEAASVKPFRIKVVRVAAGNTVESLARRMAIKDRAIERFRVLNGLATGDKVKPGDLVKIVVE